MSIKSISGYRRSYTNYYNPTLNAPNDIYAELDDTDTTEVSQEFDLNGKAWGGRLTYVAGLYFELQNTFNVQDTGPDWDDPTGYTYAANTLNKSYAAFANVSYKILDPLELTVGARYSYDTKSARSLLNFQSDYSSAGCKTFALAFQTGQACNGLYSGAASDSWDSFDPSAKLSYQVLPNAFAYISFTKGYNAGGINQQLGSNLGGGLVTYNPERLNAYEGGVKTDWFDKRLRVNSSIFYQKYQDIQTTLLVTFNGIATRQVQTGATAHEEGLELEVEALPIPDLSLHANAAYLRQHYDSIAKGVSAFTLQTPVTSAPKFEYSVDGQLHLPLRRPVAGRQPELARRRQEAGLYAFLHQLRRGRAERPLLHPCLWPARRPRRLPPRRGQPLDHVRLRHQHPQRQVRARRGRWFGRRHGHLRVHPWPSVRIRRGGSPDLLVLLFPAYPPDCARDLGRAHFFFKVTVAMTGWGAICGS